MESVNIVVMAGNLSADPEVKYTPQGTACCEFSVAVNRKYKANEEVKEEVSFIGCVAWSKQAEVIGEHLKKGDPILIEGRLQQQRWEDAETHKKNSKTKVIIERFHFIGTKRSQDNADPDTER